MSPLVDADISADTDLLGKTVSDLQEDIVISNGVISGTLHYVTGYTGFDASHPELQEGHFLALHAEAEDATSISVRPLGSAADPVPLDADGLYILHIVNATGIEYYTVIDGVTYLNVYKFDGLVMEPKEDD